METVGYKDKHSGLASEVSNWDPNLQWYAAAGSSGFMKAHCAHIFPNPQSVTLNSDHLMGVV